MILAMMIGYIVLLHLIFNVFKLVKASTRNKIYVTVIGCFFIYCILLVINVYQPMSTDLRVARYVVPLRTRLTGTVIEVPAQPNVPLKKGDVIFRIDPRSFEAQVARLKAALAEAEQQARMLPVELAAAQAAATGSEIAIFDANQQAKSLRAALDGANATVGKMTAQLELAQSNYERGLKIRQENTGAISQRDVDSLKRSVKVAEAAVAEANAKLELARLDVDSQIGGVNTVILRAEETLREAQASENKARLALESTIDGVNTTVARIRAELLGAEVDLADSVVRAPADGYVANLSLRPGQVIIPKDTGVVTFVNSEKFAIAATFKQEVIERIKPGDEAELAFDELPGKTIPAKVKNINWGIPQGQVASSGGLLDSTPTVHGRFFVQFEIENAEDFVLPPGGAGAATIYTDQGRMWVAVRKVFFRWYTWMNYVNTEMDIRGKRE